MRIAFFGLLLANLVFLVWTQGFMGARDSVREPERLERQMLPEKLTVSIMDPASRHTAHAACRQVTGVPAVQAESLRDHLQAAGLWADILARPAVERTQILLVTNDSKAVAMRRAEDLKQLNIAYKISYEAAVGYNFDLGIYESREAAQKALDTINRKGLWSPRLVRLPTPQTSVLEVRASADTLNNRLSDLVSGVAEARIAQCPE
jgi:hypothetical protein